MSQKPSLLIGLIMFSLTVSLANAGTARAWSTCGESYVVQWGDTLGSVARQCGTSVAALRLANPNLGYWLYTGQTLWLPGAYLDDGNGHAIYIVARGDTLKALAARFDTTMAVLGHLNGIYNYDLIYEGQRLCVPTGGMPPAPWSAPTAGGTYIVQWGDTLRKIAERMDVRLSDLIAVNPQIRNPSLIYVGQTIYLPESASLYSIERGDTLRIIAGRFGTTVEGLLVLNPQIWNANWIYAGQTIRIR